MDQICLFKVVCSRAKYFGLWLWKTHYSTFLLGPGTTFYGNWENSYQDSVKLIPQNMFIYTLTDVAIFLIEKNNISHFVLTKPLCSPICTHQFSLNFLLTKPKIHFTHYALLNFLIYSLSRWVQTNFILLNVYLISYSPVCTDHFPN